MKQPRDLAKRYLLLAERDMKTVGLLADVPESDDEAIGFHAQQAVEKCPKAVLSLHRIPFRKTHDLAELIDLLHDAGKPVPSDAGDLDFLNPFAVVFRYELIDLETFDRRHTRNLVENVHRWTTERLSSAAP